MQNGKRDFTEEEYEYWCQLAKLYKDVKLLILYSEELDQHSNSNIQVIKELRDAFDHIMRSFSALTGVVEGKDDKYINDHFEKAKGHVYRAAYDTLDGTVISLKDQLADCLKGYPPQIIKEAMPTYYKSKIRLHELVNSVAENRGRKDIGEGNYDDAFNSYVADVEEMKNILEESLRAQPVIDELHQEQKKRERKKLMAAIGIPILAAIVGAVAGVMLS